MEHKKRNIIGMAAVAGLWLLLTVFAWFRSPDAYSVAERRELEQFPEITAQTLLNGKFMTEFDSYTLDQFPLRDGFRSLKAQFHYNILRQKDNNKIYLAQGVSNVVCRKARAALITKRPKSDARPSEVILAYKNVDVTAVSHPFLAVKLAHDVALQYDKRDIVAT